MRKLLVLAVGLIAALGAAQAFAHQSRTQLACGALPGGAVVMTATLTCPSPGLFFTAGTTSLDCRGYSLIAPGGGGAIGIRVPGKSGITLRNCNVRGYGQDYVLIKVTKSTITNNTALRSTSAGYVVQGSFDNAFVDNLATSTARGFFLTSSGRNGFKDNAAVHNVAYGYQLDKVSKQNQFTDNLAIDNGKVGFLIQAGSSGNVFSLNRAMSNGNGIVDVVSANSNTFRSNAASGSLGGDNCRDTGAGNTWVGNVGGPPSSPAAICP